jgi:hypothetical protein
MNVNWVIGCHDKEAYWPHLKEVFATYETIVPETCLLYNGRQEDFPCDVRNADLGIQLGSMDGLYKARDFFKDSQTFRYVITCIDSWLLDESAILRIFETMERTKCCYAGNWWDEHNAAVSTDIWFLDTRWGNPWPCIEWDGNWVEGSVFKAVSKVGRILIIPDREPVHWENRYECPALKWVMHNDLESNLRRRKELAGY